MSKYHRTSQRIDPQSRRNGNASSIYECQYPPKAFYIANGNSGILEMSSSCEIDTEVYNSITDIDRNQWNEIVSQAEYTNIYNSYEWVQAIERGLEFEGHHITVWNSGNLVGIFPNFLSSVRLPGEIERKMPEKLQDAFLELSSVTPGYGGPVVRGNEKQVLSQCITAANENNSRRLLSHYIRCPDAGYVKYNDLLRSSGYTPKLSYCRFELDLRQDFESISQKMDKDRRYTLRKANEQNSEIQIEQGNINKNTLSEFYRGYVDTMERVGSEPYPLKFFSSLVDILSDSILLVSAKVDSDTVGRHLYIVDDKNGTIHHEFSAVREDQFQYYPSELIHEHMIKWGLQEKYKTYDFGVTPSDFGDGLFEYKEQYGGTLEPILTWEKGRSPLWTIYKIARKKYMETND